MKKLLALILGLALMLSLSACAPKVSPDPVDVGGPDASITDPTTVDPATQNPGTKGTITAQPPAGWEPVAGSVLPLQYMKNTSSFMAKIEGFNGKTLDDVVAQAKQAFSDAFDEVTYIGNVESVTVDGKPGAKFVFTCKIAGMVMKYEYVYVIVGGKTWAITFADFSETFGALQGDYDAILQTVKFQ